MNPGAVKNSHSGSSVTGSQTHLLDALPPRRLLGVLASDVEFSGGDLQQEATHRAAMLADEDDLIAQEWHDGDRARVTNHVSRYRPPVRRQEMVPAQLEEHPARQDPLPEQPESWVDPTRHSAQLDQWCLDRPIPAGGTPLLQRRRR